MLLFQLVSHMYDGKNIFFTGRQTAKKGIMVSALHEEPDLTELVGDFKVHIQITKETFNGIPTRLFPIHNRQHHHQN
ncbi:hypothetical protein LOK49_LG06G03304 [Camellia lanceoleosa]|uniref:Uncharacterized protein n=1 Tax=Camellia lanceoleosa TaxID=1840588 RepID=A0ACC0HBC1_9ERIC|nr:hypothetical protein LOK49_LG06G03304 [Camellia lanceoleosa]